MSTSCHCEKPLLDLDGPERCRRCGRLVDDDLDEWLGPCSRCGEWFSDHPSGWCPDQIGLDGMIDVESAHSFEVREEVQ